MCSVVASITYIHLTHLVQSRWRLAQRDKRVPEFKRNWIHIGAAYFDTRQQIKACALSRAPGAGKAARDAAAEAQAEAGIEMYCDGGWNPEQCLFDASAAAVEFTITTDAISETEEEEGSEESPQKVYDLRQQHTSRPGPVRAGRLTWAYCSLVGTGKEKATKQTNNTGELTALLQALHRAARRGKGTPKEIIWVDSLYARNLTMGVWLPRKGRNLALVKQLRAEWRQVQIRRGRHAVKIAHVRSHTGVPGNELADKLAEWGLYLDEKDPNLPYGVEKARPMMRVIAKQGRQPDPQPLGAAGVPPPRGGGTHPSNPPTPSPSERIASGDG